MKLQLILFEFCLLFFSDLICQMIRLGFINCIKKCVTQTLIGKINYQPTVIDSDKTSSKYIYSISAAGPALRVKTKV